MVRSKSLHQSVLTFCFTFHIFTSSKIHNRPPEDKSPPHPVTVGRILAPTTNKNIKMISKLGNSKVSVELLTREAANNLIHNRSLKDNKLIAFIPPYRTSRQAVIRGIPTDFTCDEIKEAITSPFEIASIRRMNRKISTVSNSDSAPPTYEPSKRVCITFKGQSIPQYVFFHMVRYEIHPFIAKLSMCYSCFRYG